MIIEFDQGAVTEKIGIYRSKIGWHSDMLTNPYMTISKDGSTYYIGLVDNSVHVMASTLVYNINGTNYYAAYSCIKKDWSSEYTTAGTHTFNLPDKILVSSASLTVTLRSGGSGSSAAGSGSGGICGCWDPFIGHYTAASAGTGGCYGLGPSCQYTSLYHDTSGMTSGAQCSFIVGGSGTGGTPGGTGSSTSVSATAVGQSFVGNNAPTGGLAGPGGETSFKIGSVVKCSRTSPSVPSDKVGGAPGWEVSNGDKITLAPGTSGSGGTHSDWSFYPGNLSSSTLSGNSRGISWSTTYSADGNSSKMYCDGVLISQGGVGGDGHTCGFADSHGRWANPGTAGWAGTACGGIGSASISLDYWQDEN